MPDISMCRNKECPLKEQCYRFKATPNDYQYYSDFEYKGGNCEYFMEIQKPIKKN